MKKKKKKKLFLNWEHKRLKNGFINIGRKNLFNIFTYKREKKRKRKERKKDKHSTAQHSTTSTSTQQQQTNESSFHYIFHISILVTNNLNTQIQAYSFTSRRR